MEHLQEHEDFKVMATIAKAYQEHNLADPAAPPSLRIRGVASGTKIDGDGERMAKSIIQMFQDAISNGTTNHLGQWTLIPLVSTHVTNGRGETEWNNVLGYVTKAEIDDNWDLWIEAELDADNADAMLLYKKLTRPPEVGKPVQLGLSIGGRVTNAGTEVDKETGRPVYTYRGATLKHVMVTSAPAYTGYLAALSKSLRGESFNKENLDMDNAENNQVNAEEAVVAVEEQDVEKTIEDTVEEQVEEVVKTESDVVDTAEVVEKSESESAVEVEEGEEVAKSEAGTADPNESLLATIAALAAQVADMGTVLKSVTTSVAEISQEVANFREVSKSIDVEEEAVVADPQEAVEVVEEVVKQAASEQGEPVGEVVAKAMSNLEQLVLTKLAELDQKIEAIGEQEVDKSISATRANEQGQKLLEVKAEDGWLKEIQTATTGSEIFGAALGINQNSSR
jgi:hypothetical protein